MIDFDALRQRNAEHTAWRERNPGPLIWVAHVHSPQGPYTATAPEGIPFRPKVQHYIGRRIGVGNYEASALANPFKLAAECDRAKVISQYQSWLGDHLREGSFEWQELLAVLEKALSPRGVVLTCWCAPKPCHGDVIKACIHQMYAVGWRGQCLI